MGLGSIRHRYVLDRGELYEGVRLAARASRLRARARRRIHAVCLLLAVPFVAAVVASNGSPQASFTPLPLLVLLGLWAFMNLDGVWAWYVSRRVWKLWRSAPEIEFVIDPDGVESRQAGVTVRIEWAAVTGVAEAPEATVFVVDRGRAFNFMVVRSRCLSSDERAMVHRWAREAPGERHWTTVRSKTPPSRIRITSASGGFGG